MSQGLPSLLPVELMVKVIMSLDGYSINNLIEAYPQISRYFLLMSDSSTVFTAPSLRHYNSKDTLDLHQFIKLYEQSIPITPGVVLRRAGPFRPPGQFDRLSFIHYTAHTPGSSRTLHFVDQAHQHTLGVSEIGYSLPGKLVSMDHTTSLTELSGTGEKSLVLKNVTKLDNFDSSALEDLTVVFCSDQSSIPTMRNIRLPQLKRLVIVYYDKFPLMENLWLGKRDRASTNPTHAVLHLLHAPSMRLHIEGPLPHFEQTLPLVTRYALGDLSAIDPVPQSENGDVMWPITHYFNLINLVGGPVSLGELVTSSRQLPTTTNQTEYFDGNFRLWAFHWKQTSIGNTPQPTIQLSTAFDGLPTCMVGQISYECSFLNPVPFKFDLDVARNIPATHPVINQPINVSVLYHTNTPAPEFEPEKFSFSVFEFLNEFGKRRAYGFALHYRWRPTLQEMTSLKFYPVIPREFIWSFYPSFFSVIGCPLHYGKRRRSGGRNLKSLVEEGIPTTRFDRLHPDKRRQVSAFTAGQVQLDSVVWVDSLRDY